MSTSLPHAQVFLFLLLLFTPFAVILACLFLRAAVATYRALIGGKSLIYPPSPVELFEIVVISFLVCLGPIFLLDLMLGAVVGFSMKAQAIGFLMAIPFCMLLTGGVVSQRLQISFGSGLIVSTCYYLFCLFLLPVLPILLAVTQLLSF
ncbi:hypothetical protein [Thalassoglobus polymorphus]|uniref:Uncharacterized protein n=1 Tax=Thalassoglobus polymorphus TaxID=2527994 RepID=A0A517QQ53_9PLAN|nr:hypothetical protein [Thalassoglobus polymorphus]QDT33768.1 hypothetical protein Mal48_30230 [Thalassoglobus polymorphus]